MSFELRADYGLLNILFIAYKVLRGTLLSGDIVQI
jgi:hypothetical protein